MFGFSVWDGIPGRDVREYKEETKPAGRPAEMARRLTTHSAGRKTYVLLWASQPKAVLGFWSKRLGWPAGGRRVCVGAGAGAQPKKLHAAVAERRDRRRVISLEPTNDPASPFLMMGSEYVEHTACLCRLIN